MSNVLSDEKKQQVIALGKLGWPLRRIEQATGVRRETAGSYLKAAGIGVVRRDGGDDHRSKPAIQVTTDSGESKPANEGGVTTDFIRPFSEKQPLQLPQPKTRCQYLRTVSGNHRTGTEPGPQCDGHLAGPGHRLWFQRRL